MSSCIKLCDTWRQQKRRKCTREWEKENKPTSSEKNLTANKCRTKSFAIKSTKFISSSTWWMRSCESVCEWVNWLAGWHWLLTVVGECFVCQTQTNSHEIKVAKCVRWHLKQNNSFIIYMTQFTRTLSTACVMCVRARVYRWWVHGDGTSANY